MISWRRLTLHMPRLKCNAASKNALMEIASGGRIHALGRTIRLNIKAIHAQESIRRIKGQRLSLKNCVKYENGRVRKENEDSVEARTPYLLRFPI